MTLQRGSRVYTLATLLVFVAFAKPVIASEFTYFQLEAPSCLNKEFVQVLTQWLNFTGDFGQGRVWVQKCRQYPESALPLSRKLKEQVFKFQNPPNILAYLGAMADSRMKARLARAWKVYTFLISDKRTYRPEEKKGLSSLPAQIEEIALAKVENPQTSLCDVELAEDSIVHNSLIESNFWNEVSQVSARKDLTSKDQSLLKEIDVCLTRFYQDPSIGRTAIQQIAFTGFPELSVNDDIPTRRLETYAGMCRDLAQKISPAPPTGRPFSRPIPLDPNILVATRAMRDDCDDEINRRIQEDEKNFPVTNPPVQGDERSPR